jgi:pyruvate-formate lyase
MSQEIPDARLTGACGKFKENTVFGEKLRDAQKSPANYRDLIVRVAGYNDFYTLLHPGTQEDIIQRTELGIGL